MFLSNIKLILKRINVFYVFIIIRRRHIVVILHCVITTFVFVCAI